VKDFGTATTHEVIGIDGAYSITYRTTGPIFSYSNLGCNPLPDLTGFFLEQNCLILNYDGEPGIVELMITLGLV